MRNRPRKIADDRAGQVFVAAVIDDAGGDEFVAAEAGDRRSFGSDVGHPPRHFGEDAVADRVTKCVVDFLEAVEVEPEQRQLAPGRQAHQLFDQFVVEAGAVEQPGDDVGAGLLAHLVSHLGAAVGGEDLFAQHMEHVHRDRDHAEDQEAP